LAFLYLFASAVFMFSIEPDTFHNFFEAVYWATAMLTTVGYGDISPHTEIGRTVAVVLMILGIGLIGSVTSTVTAFFVDEKNDRENDELKNELTEIKEQLTEIKKLLK